jgi:hypothetical protein
MSELTEKYSNILFDIMDKYGFKYSLTAEKWGEFKKEVEMNLDTFLLEELRNENTH